MNDIENQLSQIEDFQFIHEHLFTSGQPSLEQLKTIKEYGVSTLINLALSNSSAHLVHEDSESLELGLNYIQLPLLWDNPSVEQCILILDLIDHLAPEQILWLQSDNKQLTSCLMYLYRHYYMNIDMPTAHELLEQVWEPNETWTGLMHAVALQLQGRKATQELQHSLINPDHFS